MSPNPAGTVGFRESVHIILGDSGRQFAFSARTTTCKGKMSHANCNLRKQSAFQCHNGLPSSLG